MESVQKWVVRDVITFDVGFADKTLMKIIWKLIVYGEKKPLDIHWDILILFLFFPVLIPFFPFDYFLWSI